MKKLLTLLVAASGSLAVNAQQPTSHRHADSLFSRWVVDLNLLGGFASQKYTTANSAANYPGGLNVNTGQLTYDHGQSFGADAQIGYFLGKKRHFGLGAGIMYMEQHGDAILKNYGVEFQSTDGNGATFRQVVRGNDIKEEIISKSVNVPIVLKYKTRFSKHWGFTADAGAVINVRTMNSYKAKGNFDYEAIYQFQPTGDGGTTSVYDNSPVPSQSDWFITKAEFLRNNPNGNLQDYFATKRSLGYRVGTAMNPTNIKGDNPNTLASVGLLLQPSINYYLSDHVALNLGVYYMFQPYETKAQTGYRLTDGVGNYTSVINNVTASTNHDYGANLGVRFFFGRKHNTPLPISSIDKSDPTQCGLCDGTMTLHGLTPNQSVSIDYIQNGGASIKTITTVDANGLARVSNLCAGSYTGIVATINGRNSESNTIVLTEQPVRIASVRATNPSAPGVCDGSIMIRGLNAGQNVTLTYNLNDKPQATYTGAVGTDNVITFSGLCEGTYNSFKVTTSANCSATWTGSNTVLTAPVPPPPPPVKEVEVIDISTPILFDFNKSSIHESSYPTLNEASKELVEQKDLYIRVDAHTDAVGSNAYNQKLSERRANSVKAYLKKKGANPSHVKVYGHGKTEPAASNDTPEGRSKNRRAVLKRMSDNK
jgi:outer membrane protein OmpA-like peptidoglycan-associated protein